MFQGIINWITVLQYLWDFEMPCCEWLRFSNPTTKPNLASAE